MNFDRHRLTFYVSVPDDAPERNLSDFCRAVLRGGATLLELNPRAFSDDAVRAVREIASECGAPVAFRGEPEDVVRFDADGLRVAASRSARPLSEIRKVLGPDRFLGADFAASRLGDFMDAGVDFLRVDVRSFLKSETGGAEGSERGPFETIPTLLSCPDLSGLDGLPPCGFAGIELKNFPFSSPDPSQAARAALSRILRAKIGISSLRGILFDMDGTLLDSMGMWDTIGERCLRLHGKTPKPGFRDQIRMLNLRQSSTVIQQEYGVDVPLEQLMDEANRLVREFYLNEADLKPGVLPFLKEMNSRKIPMRIVTATNERLADLVFRRLGLREMFDGIDSCSATHYGKESVECFLNPAERMAPGVPPSSIAVFEDSALALETSSRAGFRTVGVYDLPAVRFTERIRAASDVYLRSFEELFQ